MKDIATAQMQALNSLAEEIRIGGRARYEQIRNVFGLLGDKWTILILLVLRSGSLRHASLRRAVDMMAPERISQRILTLKLRTFERQDIVVRRVSSDVPPHVDYYLTPKGIDLADQVRGMIDWLKEHSESHASSSSDAISHL